MKIINLRRYYQLDTNLFVEVEDEVAELLEKSLKADKAYDARVSYHNAYYSLDVGDGIEGKVTEPVESAEEIYLKAVAVKELFDAINKLPEKQKMRLFRYYIEGMAETELAKKEGVVIPAISKSIKKGRKTLKKLLKKDE